MNHNILNKIINKVAFNQWQQKINQINEEYHDTYEIYWIDDDKFEYLRFIGEFDEAYNFRTTKQMRCIYHWNNNIDLWIRTADLPKNYM